MKTVRVYYQTTLYYSEKVQVPDEFDPREAGSEDYLLSKVSFLDEEDMDSTVTDVMGMA